MEYNGEDIRKAQMEQRERILKSFGETNLFSGKGNSNVLMNSMEKAEENDIEKAKHQDGDMHPNGRWVWRQSANGGKGDWRVAKPNSGRRTAKTTASSSSEGDKTTQKTVAAKTATFAEAEKKADEFLAKHSGEFADWLRWENDEDYDEKTLAKFKQLVKDGWEFGRAFDWKEEEAAEEYVDKMKAKGYKVQEIDDGSDTYQYLIKKVKKSDTKTTTGKGEKKSPKKEDKYYRDPSEVDDYLAREYANAHEASIDWAREKFAKMTDRAYKGWLKSYGIKDDSSSKKTDSKKSSSNDTSKKDSNDGKMPKISLSKKDFTKRADEETESNALSLNNYIAKEVEYYDNKGKKKKASPFISEFYSSNRQNKVGGYEAYFDRGDSIGTFRTFDEAVNALNSWINKMRVPNHAEPKWIYSSSKGDYQMNYKL